MNILRNLIIVSVLFFISSCQSGTGTFKTKKGFEYTFHKRGNGVEAKPTDVISFAISLFADSLKLQDNNDPANLPTITVPRGWDTLTPPNPFLEIFAKVKVGDSLTLKIPVDSLPPNPQLMGKKFLKYLITVKDIKDSASYAKVLEQKEAERMKKIEAQAARIPQIQEMLKNDISGFKSGKLNLTTTESGLKYIIHEQGKGAVPKKGEMVKVDYYGVLMNNAEFDNSFKRGEPITFPLGQGSVIPGWEEILLLLPKGSKATVFIPSKLGYGAMGSGPIPANSDLVFYMEVL